MAIDKRLTISLTPEQYDFIKRMALKNYEGRFSQAIRSIIQTYINLEAKTT